MTRLWKNVRNGHPRRALADGNVFTRPKHCMLVVDPELGEKLYGHLDNFITADDRALENVSAQLASLALEGPNAVKAMRALGDAAFRTEQWGARVVAQVSINGLHGFPIVFPVETSSVAAQLGNMRVPGADEDVFRTIGLETNKPIYGEDITKRFLAQETNQVHALHLRTGCYFGQEIAPRVRSHGLIRRVLVPLRIGAKEPPAPGTNFQIDGETVTQIMSSAYSPAFGQVGALAYVHIEHATPDTDLQLGTTSATNAQPFSISVDSHAQWGAVQ